LTPFIQSNIFEGDSAPGENVWFQFEEVLESIGD